MTEKKPELTYSQKTALYIGYFVIGIVLLIIGVYIGAFLYGFFGAMLGFV